MAKLQSVYRYYNRRYFNNRLPKKPTLRWKDMDLMGYQQGHEIVLNRRDRNRGRVWRFTLLHEMVHLGQLHIPSRRAHGREFKKEMMRLAKAGAFDRLW